MKVLNLYSGLGGNRKLWGDEHDITAVEWDGEIARAYADNFSNDRMIVGDAHQFLLDHHNEFDFIWTSPPCPTHSRARFWGYGAKEPVYTDTKLYQEITLLKHHFNGKYVVENVKPYYDYWIQPTRILGRHAFWANFTLGHFEPSNEVDIHNSGRKPYEEAYGFCLDGYDIYRKDRKLRNCVHPEIGGYIFDRAQDIITKSNTEQASLF